MNRCHRNPGAHPLSYREAARKRAGAFTLVELLVVISIVAVLAGIVFPVLRSVNEQGKRADSISKLRTISIGFTGFLQDNNQKFMDRLSPTLMQSTNRTMFPAGSWDGVLAPYISGSLPEIYHCKRDSRPSTPVPTLVATHTYPRSYTLNPSIINLEGLMATYGANQDANKGLNANVVTKPSSFALVFESFSPTYANYVGQDSGSSSANPQAPINQDGFLVVCMDGHVDWVKPTSAWSTYGKTFQTNYCTVNK